MDETLVEKVLRAVEAVPPGRVVSYGDIATLAGIGPRSVGAVMSRFGSGVAWWRVTNVAGELPPALLPEARRHWTAEGITLANSGRGCRIAVHHADLAQLSDDFARATADLTSDPG